MKSRLFRDKKFTNRIKYTAMFKNYFKASLRKLARNKIFSFVNVFGLAAGLALFGIICLFIKYENSFDKFHPNANRLFRLNTTIKYEGTTPSTLALSSAKIGTFLLNNFSEFESYTRVVAGAEDILLKYRNQEMVFPKSISADSNFFSVFNFRFVYGDRATALSNPDGIVITEKIATTVFNKENPVGKILSQVLKTAEGKDTTVSSIITGVVEVPETSHLQFDAVFPVGNYFASPYFDWHSLAATTYVVAKSSSINIAAIEKNIPSNLRKVMQGSQSVELHLQPLLSVHLNSGTIANETLNYKKFDKKYIAILWIVAAFVLFIAVVNFTNLSVALSTTRTKEIAVRKTSGAGKWNIITQSLGESMMYAFVAFVFAFFLMTVILPGVSDFTQHKLRIIDLLTPASVTIAVGLTLLLGLLGGFYPALIISGVNPIQAFKSKIKFKGSGSKKNVVETLVVGQFAIAVALIICTVLVVFQLNFLRKVDMGFDKAQVITVPTDYMDANRYAFLKQELLKVNGVAAITQSSKLMGQGFNQNGAAFTDTVGKLGFMAMQCLSVRENFCSFYKMKIITGQYFSANAEVNQNEYIINEALAKKIGWANPVGQTFNFSWASPGKIVGVVKDFNSQSLHKKIEPAAIGVAGGVGGVLSIKIAAKDIAVTLASVEKIWKKSIPDKSFNYKFLDESIDALYASERKLSYALGIMSVLIIIIASLGLFALSVFIAQQRIREIGIRKVLGATVLNITAILSKDFLKLIVIAIVIASPIAWWFINNWLQDFAYKINIGWQVFAFTGLAAIVIAMFTISFQAIKAALANPVKSLRTE